MNDWCAGRHICKMRFLILKFLLRFHIKCSIENNSNKFYQKLMKIKVEQSKIPFPQPAIA